MATTAATDVSSSGSSTMLACGQESYTPWRETQRRCNELDGAGAQPKVPWVPASPAHQHPYAVLQPPTRHPRQEPRNRRTAGAALPPGGSPTPAGADAQCAFTRSTGEHCFTNSVRLGTPQLYADSIWTHVAVETDGNFPEVASSAPPGHEEGPLGHRGPGGRKHALGGMRDDECHA